MRAAFCGKGGSGKTSLTSLFTRFVLSKGYETLAIDGDINQHLAEGLQLDQNALKNLSYLGEDIPALQKFVKGENEFIESADHVAKSTPAGRGSNFITFQCDDEISNRFIYKNGNLRFMAIGGHTEKDVGATCYHKFTGALEIFLNHVLDQDNEILISDMCAGADPFASSGIAGRFDAIYLVCEPTKKSLAVFDQAKYYSQYHNVKLFVLGNKIDNAEDESFIKNYTGDYYLTGFKTQQAFKKAERGQPYQLSDLDAETIASLETVLESLKQQAPRDWKKYQQTSLFFHQRAAESWANTLYGSDLMKQVDPDFQYEDVMPKTKKAA
jgi:CO dehydrogenase maturation factor